MTVLAALRARVAVYLVTLALLAATGLGLEVAMRGASRAEEVERQAAVTERAARAHYAHARAVQAAYADSLATARSRFQHAAARVSVVDPVHLAVDGIVLPEPRALVDYVVASSQVDSRAGAFAAVVAQASVAADTVLAVSERHETALRRSGRARWLRGVGIGAALTAAVIVAVEVAQLVAPHVTFSHR